MRYQMPDIPGALQRGNALAGGRIRNALAAYQLRGAMEDRNRARQQDAIAQGAIGPEGKFDPQAYTEALQQAGMVLEADKYRRGQQKDKTAQLEYIDKSLAVMSRVAKSVNNPETMTAANEFLRQHFPNNPLTQGLPQQWDENARATYDAIAGKAEQGRWEIINSYQQRNTRTGEVKSLPQPPKPDLSRERFEETKRHHRAVEGNQVVQVHDPASPSGTRYVTRQEAVGKPGKPTAAPAPAAPTRGDFTNLESLMASHPELAGMEGMDQFKFAVAARTREIMKTERLNQYRAMQKAVQEFMQQVEPGQEKSLFGIDWLKPDRPPVFNPDKPIRRYNPATGRIE